MEEMCFLLEEQFMQDLDTLVLAYGDIKPFPESRAAFSDWLLMRSTDLFYTTKNESVYFHYFKGNFYIYDLSGVAPVTQAGEDSFEENFSRLPYSLKLKILEYNSSKIYYEKLREQIDNMSEEEKAAHWDATEKWLDDFITYDEEKLIKAIKPRKQFELLFDENKSVLKK